SLKTSLDIFQEAGMERLRKKSLRLTGYLEQRLLKEVVSDNCQIVTPSDPQQRGCQLSLRVPGKKKEVTEKFLSHQIICDFRVPLIDRLPTGPSYESA